MIMQCRPNIFPFRFPSILMTCLQACRGNSTDPGITVQSKTLMIGDKVDSIGSKPKFFQIPSMADLLVMYSTYEGNFIQSSFIV